MMETCGQCSADYALTSENAGIVVYLDYLPASHVWALCTHCRARETIYCAPRTLSGLTKGERFGVVVETESSRERREAADAAWGRHREAVRSTDPGPAEAPGDPVPVEADLPDLPREWRRQLHDDLRAFGSGLR